MFDDGVVQGQSTAIMNLQKALGVKADGVIGSETLGAAKNTNYAVRQDFIDNARMKAQNIAEKNPTQKKFIDGWLNRINNY